MMPEERMPEAKPTSERLRSFFVMTERDEEVFVLDDYPGLQIVRKYEEESDYYKTKRMFITFFLHEENGRYLVFGSINIVTKKKIIEGTTIQWVVEPGKGVLLQKPTNYSITRVDKILFDPVLNKILFRGKNFTINSFVDLLENNHLRDMFFWAGSVIL